MTDRFLGLTKTQFGIIMLVALAIVASAQTYSLYRQELLARDGRQAHAALCVFRSDLAKRAADNEAFLRLTVKQRVAKYGQLGRIPEATIRQSLKGQQGTLASLDALRCG